MIYQKTASFLENETAPSFIVGLCIVMASDCLLHIILLAMYNDDAGSKV